MKKENIPSFFILFGISAILTSFALLYVTFSDLILSEIRYVYQSSNNNGNAQIALNIDNDADIEETISTIIAADKDFSIIIPKIGANTRVIKNVDAHNAQEYQYALTKGVAHAEESALPNDKNANVFLFAHSSDNFYNANQYNSVFYLLHRLESGDKFYIVYEGEVIPYTIEEKKIVNADEVSYLDEKSLGETATLMTCWPPGTTLKRLVVVGKQKKDVDI